MNADVTPQPADEAEEGRTRRALLHVLEDLQRERDAVNGARRGWLNTVDAIASPLVVVDRELRIVRANRAYAERAGMGFKEIVGRPYVECFPRLGGPAKPVPDHFELPDGETFVVRSFPVTEGGPEQAEWLHLFEDITARRRAEEVDHALLLIADSEALLEGGVATVARLATEAAARITGVARANVWLFNETEDELRCIDLYEPDSRRHSDGYVLREHEFQNEFHALKTSPYVDANDPLTDPRTRGYVESYVKPLGITSMLDTVVRISGKNIGVLCLEHVARPHTWKADEIALAARLADKIAVAVSNQARRQAQQELERRERYFRKLIERSTDAFVVVDRAGNVIYRSESGKQITGYENADVLGKPLSCLIAPESLAAARDALRRRVENPAATGRVEVALLRSDGSRVEVEMMGRNLLADPDVGGVVVTMHDITERKVAERRIAALNTLYATLSAVNHAIVQSKSRQEVCERIVRIATEIGPWQAAWIGFADPQTKRIVPTVWSQGMVPHLDKLAVSTDPEVPEGQGPSGMAVRNGVPYFCNDILADLQAGPWREFAQASGINSVASIPLLAAGVPAGVVNLYSSEKEIFTPEVRALVVEMGDDITYALETIEKERQRTVAEAALAEHQAKLRRGLEATIEAIAATVETRDPYTAGHQRRVADLAHAIGREMGLPKSVQEGLHFGALIHDLGKVQVPAEILSKPTRLSKLEFELVKTHPQTGYDIVKGIEFPWPVADMVLQHHERIDGSGYPRGLKGDAICPEARIIAVADVVEAMASHRPYRPGLGIDAALKEITAKRGVWFEPAAVDACLAIFRDKRFSFDR